jgi:hypothetical protein
MYKLKAFTEESEFGVGITERGNRKFTIRFEYPWESGGILMGALWTPVTVLTLRGASISRTEE